LNLDWYHKPQGLFVTDDSFAWVMPNDIPLENPAFHPVDPRLNVCFSRQTRDFHAMEKNIMGN
jgi:hypothetical protein